MRSAPEVRAREVSTHQVGLCEVGAREVGLPEDGVGEIGVREASASEVSARDVGAPEVGAIELDDRSAFILPLDQSGFLQEQQDLGFSLTVKRRRVVRVTVRATDLTASPSFDDSSCLFSIRSLICWK